MRTAITLLKPVLAILLFRAVQAQDKPWEMAGRVVSIETGEEQLVKLAQVTVTVRGFPGNAKTDAFGRFVIHVPADATPGQEVVILHDKSGYEIFHPFRGVERLPSAGTPPPFNEIRMLPKGSKQWFANELVDSHADYERSRSAAQLVGQVGGLFDFEASLRGLSVYTGITQEETRKQLTSYINRFRIDASNRHRQANAEFLAGNFQLSGALYLKAAEGLDRGAPQQIRLAAYEHEAAADAFENAFDFARAADTYQSAGRLLAVARAARLARRLDDYATSSPDARRLRLRATNSRVNSGVRLGGKQLSTLVSESLKAYRDLLAETSRVTESRDWSAIQNNFGNALVDLAADSHAGRDGELLVEAIKSFKLALDVRTRGELPQEWATTQNNLGNALADLAARSDGRTAKGLLSEAVNAYKLSLQFHRPNEMPLDWAAIQTNLANALVDLAARSPAPRAAGQLRNRPGITCRFHSPSGTAR